MKTLFGFFMIIIILLHIIGLVLIDKHLIVIETRLISILANQTAPEPLDLFKKKKGFK